MSRGLRLDPDRRCWSGSSSGSPGGSIKPPDPAVPSQMVEAGRSRSSISAPAVPGKAGLNSADLTGGGPHLVNIFASWCVPCAGEAPVLSELQAAAE